MPRPPQISVQLIHIEGPLKGEIQEFTESEISIGRDPSCQVRFPKDYATISRVHAKILREGNRFKLVNHGKNGTFIKGKSVDEAYLSSGDVLIFAEQSGPKVSFITEMREPADVAPSPAPRSPEPAMAAEPPVVKPPLRPVSTPPPMPEPPPVPVEPAPPPPGAVEIVPVQVPLAIQCGAMLKAYKLLPITLGRHPSCEFPLEHPALADRHAQIFFARDRYGVKDLTGQNRVAVNDRPIGDHAFLSPNDRISLTPGGPYFQFFAGGRLAEAAPPEPADPAASKAAEKETPMKESEEKKGKSILGKFFNR